MQLNAQTLGGPREVSMAAEGIIPAAGMGKDELPEAAVRFA